MENLFFNEHLLIFNFKHHVDEKKRERGYSTEMSARINCRY